MVVSLFTTDSNGRFRLVAFQQAFFSESPETDSATAQISVFGRRAVLWVCNDPLSQAVEFFVEIAVQADVNFGLGIGFWRLGWVSQNGQKGSPKRAGEPLSRDVPSLGLGIHGLLVGRSSTHFLDHG